MSWIANGITDPNSPFIRPADYTHLVTVEDQTINGIVTTGFSSAQTYASSAFATAQTFLTTMGNFGWINTSIDTHLAALDINIAQFNYLLGTVPATPANTFAFTEVPYSSNLLTDLRARLLEWVDGKSTGILPSVEQAIWDRGRAKEITASNRKAQEAVRSFAMRGFSKPPGALSLEIQEAAQEAQNNSVTLSREIMIKQADLEQSNRRFSFEQAGKMEEALIAYTNQQMQRALDKARELQKFIIDIYQADVAAYGVETQAYAARVGAETSVFKAKTDAQVAEANIRIEAAKVQIQALIQQLTLRVETTRAGAQVSGQLAAAALAAISLHGSVGSTVSNTASNTTTQTASVSDGQTTSLGVGYSYSGAAV